MVDGDEYDYLKGLVIELLKNNFQMGLTLKNNLEVIKELNEYIFPDEDLNNPLTGELHQDKIQ